MDDARQWAEEQWSACDLGDRRRTRRAVALGVRMAEHSDRSLPRQMAGMADLKAAYRLLDSEGVTLEALTAPTATGFGAPPAGPGIPSCSSRTRPVSIAAAIRRPKASDRSATPDWRTISPAASAPRPVWR